MTDKMTFEEAYQQLEKIVADIENEETPLEELLALYEKGNELSTHCRRILKKTEEKLDVLKQSQASEEA